MNANRVKYIRMPQRSRFELWDLFHHGADIDQERNTGGFRFPNEVISRTCVLRMIQMTVAINEFGIHITSTSDRSVFPSPLRSIRPQSYVHSRKRSEWIQSPV